MADYGTNVPPLGCNGSWKIPAPLVDFSKSSAAHTPSQAPSSERIKKGSEDIYAMAKVGEPLKKDEKEA